MVDTPRTQAALITASADNTTGNYTNQNQRDFIVSVPLWDDPANVSGLGAPAILRGTVSAHKASGLTMGTGMSTPVRQANATALQNAINYAASANKFFEIIPGIYEINSSTGLMIAFNSGFTWRGAMGGDSGNGYPGSQIIQFYSGGTGAPVLTIGDTTGVNLPGFMDIRGFNVSYGFAPTGLTGASTLVFGGCAMCNFDMIGVQVGGSYSGGTPAGFNGYNGVLFTGGQFFSNHFGSLIVYGAQNTLFNALNFTTGTRFDNVYLNNGGGGAYVPLSGSYMYLGQVGEATFGELNMEWGACNRVIDANASQINVDLLHVEGIKGTGYIPCILSGYQSTIDIQELHLVTLILKAANISSSGGAIFIDTPTLPSQIIVGSLGIFSNTASEIDTNLWMVVPNPNYPSGNYGINHGTYRIDSFMMAGGFISQYNSLLSIDPHMQVSASTYRVPQRFSSYEWGIAASTVRGAVIPVSATYTHYGQYESATLLVPTSVTGFTITLANTMGASPSTQPVRTGCRVHVTRLAGTSVGVVLVKDGAGSTISTLAAGVTTPTDYDYVFNGTQFVAFTAVPTGGGWIA